MLTDDVKSALLLLLAASLAVNAWAAMSLWRAAP